MLGATAYKKFDVPADWADAEDETVTTQAHRPRAGVVKHGRGHHDPRGHVWTATACLFPPSLTHVDGQFELGAAAYEKRGVCRLRSHLGRYQVHPVQQLRLCLPPCYHPSLRSD